MPTSQPFNSSFTSGRRASSGDKSSPARPPVASLEPTDAELLLHRARNAAYAEAAGGRLGRGLALLQDALDQEPMSHDLLADMAALLLSAGQFDRAIGYAQRALGVIPDHGPSMYALGFALSAQRQSIAAIEVLTRLTWGAPRRSLLAEAPELAPLVQTELDRLRELMAD